MTFICYKWKQFTKAHTQVIEQLNAIIEEFGGYAMTARGIFYQGVGRNWWPNNFNSYKRVCGILDDGRMAGLISWAAVEDLGRNLMGHNTFESPKEAFAEVNAKYKLDLWHNQQYRPEVWVEKQAQEGTVGRACQELRVDYFATKGYNSQSEQWAAGRRLAGYVKKGQTPIVFHLGDHDPSGIDMTRDIRERLALFAGVPVTVVRLGLNMDQVEQYSLPENYVKINARGEYSDSRAQAYVDEFGDASWELDALSPKVIHDLIQENILRLRDQELWDEALEEETTDKRRIEELTEGFE